MLYARSVVVGRVIRSLCLRKVAAAGDQIEYKAVFVDYSIDKEEWEKEETSVGGVPVISGHWLHRYPKLGDVSMHVVGVGDIAGLWLLHKRPGLKRDEETTTRLTRFDKRNMTVDVYVHKPEGKAFVHADRIWIPAMYRGAQGGASAPPYASSRGHTAIVLSRTMW